MKDPYELETRVGSLGMTCTMNKSEVAEAYTMFS